MDARGFPVPERKTGAAPHGATPVLSGPAANAAAGEAVAYISIQDWTSGATAKRLRFTESLGYEWV